jgi:hypothetical protein
MNDLANRADTRHLSTGRAMDVERGLQSESFDYICSVKGVLDH